MAPTHLHPPHRPTEPPGARSVHPKTLALGPVRVGQGVAAPVARDEDLGGDPREGVQRPAVAEVSARCPSSVRRRRGRGNGEEERDEGGEEGGGPAAPTAARRRPHFFPGDVVVTSDEDSGLPRAFR